MVVFTCNNCGESLQKPKVDKHYQTVCRSTKNLTCVDCFKDFWGEDYAIHIKCVTEEDRYAAKGSRPSGVVKKGEAKQQGWTSMLSKILEKEENLSLPIKNLMNIIANYVNVPRKKPRFFNFVQNSFGRNNYNPRDLEFVWDLIEKHKNIEFEQAAEKKAEEEKKKQMEEELKKHNEDTNGQEKGELNEKQNGETNEKQNGQTAKRKVDTNGNQDEANTEKPKKKKSKKTEAAETDAQEQNGEDATSEAPKKKKKKSKNTEATEANGHKENCVNGTEVETTKTKAEEDTFSYEGKILEILQEKKQMSLKKLQKKVLGAYLKAKGVEEYSEKHVKKFNKHLKKVANVEINDNIVTLT